MTSAKCCARFLAASMLIVAGCVTGQDGATPSVASGAAAVTCDKLTEARREVIRRIDATEHGRETPNSAAGLIVLIGVLGGTPGSTMTPWLDMADKDRQRALNGLREGRSRLDKEIDDRQCTAEARAKAGALKAVESAQYDGLYAGKGQTESWCGAPTISLDVRRGRISGTLREGANAAADYDIRGQLYENGDVSLTFKRPGSTTYTDDFDGRVQDRNLSFAARLDTTAKACTYRFALRRDAAPDGSRVPSPTPRMFSGPWKATALLMVDRSGLNCRSDLGAYSLDLSNDRLAIDGSGGRLLTVPVPVDGSVSQTFNLPSEVAALRTTLSMQGRTVRVTLVGNARTRDLEVVQGGDGCRWKLTPDEGFEWAVAPPPPPPAATPPPPAVAAPPPPPPPAQTVASAPAGPTVRIGTFDGDYRGGLQLGALAPGNSYERVSEALRSIEVSVSNGVGTGTVRQQRCAGVGPVSLKIDAKGTVSGEMDALVTNTCDPLKVVVGGRFEREILYLTASSGRASVEFSLQRVPNP